MIHNQNIAILKIPVYIKYGFNLNLIKNASVMEGPELKILVTSLALARLKCKQEFDSLIYKLSGKAAHTVSINAKLFQLVTFIKVAFSNKTNKAVLSL